MKARFAAIAKAVAAFAALSLLSAYLLGLPGAARIDEDKQPAAHAGEMLLLRGLTGPLLAITSASGTSAAIVADRAVLDATSRSGLALLGQQAPDAPGPVQWVDQGGGGGAAIGLTLAPAARPADVEVRRSYDPQSIELYFTPHGAPLQVAAVVPYSAGRQSDTVLHLGDQVITQRGAGAVPLTFIIPDGGSVSVRLPTTDQARARFALGSTADGIGPPLSLTAVDIANQDGVRAAYCGAERGALLWRTRDLAKTTCRPVLHASQLVVGANVGLDLSGIAFQSTDGVVAASPAITRITENPLAAAFLALCYAGVAKWLFQAFFPSAAKKAE